MGEVIASPSEAAEAAEAAAPEEAGAAAGSATGAGWKEPSKPRSESRSCPFLSLRWNPSFANVGDAISEGQTLCIIEAMKVMNEIKAEKSGVITAVLAEDGNPVQFGDILFRIK